MPVPAEELSDYDPMFAVGCMTSWYWSGFDHVNHFHGAVDEVMLYRRVLSARRSRRTTPPRTRARTRRFADDTPCFDLDHCTQGDTCQRRHLHR